MAKSEDEELINTFLNDIKEALAKLEENLLHLESSTDPALVNDLFRAAHSVKGGASFLEYKPVIELSHAMEHLLGKVRDGEYTPRQDDIDALLEAVDMIKICLDNPEMSYDITQLKVKLSKNFQDNENLELKNEEVEKKSRPALTLAMETNGPIHAPPPEKNQTLVPDRVSDQVPDQVPCNLPKANETLKITVLKTNKLVSLASELVLARNQILSHQQKKKNADYGGKNAFQNIDRVTTEIQTEIMGMRMQPISIVFNKFPRIIREIANKINKKIKIEIIGENVELDKTIIESISDPLNHIVRNSADHGLEAPEDRIKNGKSAEGKIILKAYHAGGQVYIEIKDDGRGIDAEKVINKAIENRLLTKEQAQTLSTEEKLKFIFAPGLSTAEKVTDISGRGVGMDVVKTNIEKLGGHIDIETILGKGTALRISLPLTLAIISGLIVEVDNLTFAIPHIGFEELLRVTSKDYHDKIFNVENCRVLKVRDELLPLVHLGDCLSLKKNEIKREALAEKGPAKKDLALTNSETILSSIPSKKELPTRWNLKILIVTTGNNKFALIVDKIVGFEEIIVKSMPAHLRYLNTYAGVTVLGNGKVALIIDISGISQKNKLIFDKIQNAVLNFNSKNASKGSAENASVLIFKNNQDKHYAILLSLIRRVDKIIHKDIQTYNGKQFINYMNDTTRIIDFNSSIDMNVEGERKPPAQCDNDGKRLIVIPKNLKRPVALLIGQGVETREIPLKLEENGLGLNDPFVSGTAIIDGKITVLLNIYNIFEHYENDCFSLNKSSLKSKKQIKILLVEDTQLYLKLTTDYLKEQGHQVITADNGKIALEILLTGTAVDLVITDIDMPEMDGLELTENIRSNPQFKCLPIIALTSITNEKSIKRGMQIGINRWLPKNDKINLISTINEIVEAELCK